MGNNLPPGVTVSDLPGNRPKDKRYDELIREGEDPRTCKHCGEVIEDHPEDHRSGCEAVTEEPQEAEQIPEEYEDQFRPRPPEDAETTCF